MFIDVNTYIGHWPFRQVGNNTAEELVKLMDEEGIDMACVSNINSIFYRNVQDGNEELAEEVKPYNNRLIPFAIINPAYPGWEKDFKRCIDELGMKGLELYPSYHQYSLTDSTAVELLNMAADRNIPVHLPCAIENLRQRHWLDTKEDLSADSVKQVLALCPNTNFIITNGPTHSIASYLQTASVDRQGKVYYDFCRVDMLNSTFDRFVEAVGADRVVFGSVMPLQYLETQFVKLQFSKLGNEDKEKIMYKNLKELLKL
ncbi:MAG TPA: amidohydrolase family protein, partial [Clostridiales bacterium]|nr:amidohydrolase family protein [Clostridiales bacterium]